MDDSHFGYRIIALIILTLVNAFFSAAEVALLTVRPSRMEELAKKGNIGAQAAVSLIGNMERMISLAQVGITLASLGMGWMGEEALFHAMLGWFQPYMNSENEFIFRLISFTCSFLLLTLVLVVIGEVVPKNLGVEKAERVAILTSPAMLICYRILEPFVLVVERLSALVARVFGLQGTTHSGGHSIEEIKHIVTSSGVKGALAPFEEAAIRQVLDLHALVAREVMVPRSNVISVPIDASLDDVLKMISTHNYSRVPVYKDDPENIVGVIHYRDLLRVWRERRSATERRRTARPFHLSDWLRKPPVVPETKPLNELIDEFRAGHSHLALVVDEFGTISGVITLEDVLEEIFGEIDDEHDARRDPHHREEPIIEVDGTIPIRDLETQYGIDLPFEAGFETLAGFLLSRFGFIPQGGEQLAEGGRRYTVQAMDRNRIAIVKIERLDAVSGNSSQDDPGNPSSAQEPFKE